MTDTGTGTMQAQPLATPAVRPGVTARPGRGRLASLAVMAVVAVVILGVTVLVNRPATTTADGVTRVDLIGSPQGPPPIVGQAAPPFSVAALDGSTVELTALAGKPVWVTFGATWCQPCRAENPDIQAAFEANRASGLVVVQVYMNEDESVVADYTSRVGLEYVKVPDPTGRLSIEYRILGIPSHFFIDRAGVLRQVKVGTLDRAGMDAILAELMR